MISVHEENDLGTVDLVGETAHTPLNYLIDGNKKHVSDLNLLIEENNSSKKVPVGIVSVDIQLLRRNQPISKQPFVPGCLKIMLKEALLLDNKTISEGNLVTKIEFQGLPE